MSSETASVFSKLCSLPCRTKPRSVPTGPPAYHGLPALRVGVSNGELLEQAGELQVQWAVDDDAKRTIVVMLTNKRNGRAEIRVLHTGHSDKQLIYKRAV